MLKTRAGGRRNESERSRERKQDEGERFYWHDNQEVSAGRSVQRPFG